MLALRAGKQVYYDRPITVIISAVLHLCVAYALLYHPVFKSGPVFNPDMMVKLIELPAGEGGVTEGELGTPEEPEKVAEVEPPPPDKPPKLTLPGPDKPKPKIGPTIVKTDKPGKALGLGKGGPVGLGGKDSGIILDQSTFEYEWYKARLKDTLKSHWNKPVAKGKKTTSASVHFIITNSGDTRDVQLVQSSGDPTFDQSVLRAIYESVPFPKFPPAYQEDELGVLYTFELIPEK